MMNEGENKYFSHNSIHTNHYFVSNIDNSELHTEEEWKFQRF